MHSTALGQEQAAAGRALQAQGYSLRHVGPLLSLWAITCGVLASNRFDLRDSGEWLRLAALALLITGGWERLWGALGHTDWAAPLEAWRNWRSERHIPALPYTRPASVAGRCVRTIGQFRAWWHCYVRLHRGGAIAKALAALFLAAVLALLLGPEIVLLTAACLAVVELAIAWDRGRGKGGSGWRVCIAVFLPWVAGHITFGPLSAVSAWAACSVALAIVALGMFGRGAGRALMGVAGLSLAGILVLTRHPVAACWVLVCHILPYLSLPWRGGERWPVKQQEYGLPFLLIAGLIAAWTL